MGELSGMNEFTVPWSADGAILFDFRALRGTSDGRMEARRRAFSAYGLDDDLRFRERPGETSPPYPDIGLKPGQAMREDWSPVRWKV